MDCALQAILTIQSTSIVTFHKNCNVDVVGTHFNRTRDGDWRVCNQAHVQMCNDDIYVTLLFGYLLHVLYAYYVPVHCTMYIKLEL
jgi:hypothetical protein